MWVSKACSEGVCIRRLVGCVSVKGCRVYVGVEGL